MRFKQVDDHPKTFVLILETAEELASTLNKFATEKKLSASSFKAIGAFLPSSWDGSIGRPRNT